MRFVVPPGFPRDHKVVRLKEAGNGGQSVRA